MIHGSDNITDNYIFVRKILLILMILMKSKFDTVCFNLLMGVIVSAG
jgi:hypothetical protein